ncbi:MAG: hypothetical protein U5K74_04395 [Gemmatimonadaceae bacterium]|nr:hypothetical protein [Gemmatimonadaceae bacterium]
MTTKLITTRIRKITTPDGVVAADQDEGAERLDHLARVPVAEDQPGGADVQAEAEQGERAAAARGERAELEGILGAERDQQHDQRAGDARSEEQVEDDRGQRHDEQRDDRHHADGECDFRGPGRLGGAGGQ